MRWWQIALYGSLLWLVVVSTISGFLIYRIVSKPMGRAAAEKRAQALGTGIGTFSAPCLAGVWIFAWIRRQSELDEKKGESRKPSRKRGKKSLGS